MHPQLVTSTDTHTVPIIPLTENGLKSWLTDQPEPMKRWCNTQHFEAKPGSFILIPAKDGTLERVLCGITDEPDLWALGDLPTQLPEGLYAIDDSVERTQAECYALGWLLGSYRYDRYLSDKPTPAKLAAPQDTDVEHIHQQAEAICLVRDLITTPPADMMPSDLANTAQDLAKRFDAECAVIVGDDLLKENYPSIHTVGRASANAPRLIDIRWGKTNHPKVTLVGKGVCFDSGGLDIKSSSGMALMRKDMGGSAHVLGLAMLIMSTKLPVRLRVLVPAVENAISSNAFRTSDVITTRSGKTVEVGNTDAEGRLILCDALTEADSESPDLIIDCATLTGAARVALGTEMPAVFSCDDELAQTLVKHSMKLSDPLWQLPLWEGYRPQLDCNYADLSSTGQGGFGGAITAALFLKSFVTACPHWLHVDMMAWNVKPRPGRPTGGEAMGLRALYHLIRSRYTTDED